MNQLVDQYPVQRVADVLEVSRMSVYRSSEACLREQQNVLLTHSIRRVYDHHRQRYGSPRITMQLHAEGKPCGANRVARLMR